MAQNLKSIKARRQKDRPKLTVPEWADEPFFVGPMGAKAGLHVLAIQRKLMGDAANEKDEAKRNAAFKAALEADEDAATDLNVNIIAGCLQNVEGELVFDSPEGRSFLQSEDLELLVRVAGDLQGLKGLTPEGGENPEKNSETIPENCSSGSLPSSSESPTSSCSPSD
jgi:hypothetical protein